MPNITTFDSSQRYILIPVLVTGEDGKVQNFRALLDTGAPSTEFSDEALQFAGFVDEVKQSIQIKTGLQTQKYGKIMIPKVKICSHSIDNLQVYVSHFEKSWGIDALIGLDFFRRFRTTVDYKLGALVTESLSK